MMFLYYFVGGGGGHPVYSDHHIFINLSLTNKIYAGQFLGRKFRISIVNMLAWSNL